MPKEIDPKQIEEETLQEVSRVMNIPEEYSDRLRNEKLFQQYVQSNIQRAETEAAREARCKDLNDTKHSIHEKIREAGILDVEKILGLIEALERLSKLEAT